MDKDLTKEYKEETGLDSTEYDVYGNHVYPTFEYVEWLENKLKVTASF